MSQKKNQTNKYREEENLKPLFEKNESYKTAKNQQLKAFIDNYYPKKSTIQIIQDFFKTSTGQIILGASSSFIISGLLLALILNQSINPNNSIITPDQLFGTVKVSASEISLKPTKQSSTGIQTNSEFEIESKVDIQSEQIEDAITISPEVDFEIVEKQENRKFVIRLDEELESNEIYNIQLNTENDSDEGSEILSWAFQTEEKFRINSTIPGNQSLGVPTDSSIEINFNTSNFADISDYFSITPNVNGRFERNGKTAVFVPDSLEPGTVYTVKINKEVSTQDLTESLEEDYIFEFETGSEGRILGFEFGRRFYEFRPNSDINLNISTNENSTNEAEISIFSFKDRGQIENILPTFVDNQNFWAVYGYNQNIDTKNLIEVSKTVSPIQQIEFQEFIRIPNNLPKGVYIIQARQNNSVTQSLLQITNIASALQQWQENNLLWVQDLETQSPIQGAKISTIKTDLDAQTDEDGISLFDSSRDVISETDLFSITANEETVYIPGDSTKFVPQGFLSNTNEKQYWGSLYTDRGAYKTTDKIQLWGFIKPRDNDKKTPEKLKVKLSYEYYDGNTFSEIDYYNQDIEVVDNNFLTEIEFTDLKSDFYTLKISDGDKVIRTKLIDIFDYQTPTYNFTVAPDKTAVFAGETVNFDGKVTFFEGTPPNNLEIISRWNGEESIITTNENGEFTYSRSFPSSNFQSKNEEVTFTPRFSENSNMINYHSIRVFSERTKIDVEQENNGNQPVLNFSFNDINLDQINLSKDQNADFTGNPQANKEFSIRGFLYENVRVPDGTTYNNITKRNETSYRIEKQYRGFKDFYDLRTDANGKATASLEIPENQFYEYSVYTEPDKAFEQLIVYPERRVINTNNNIFYSIITDEDKTYEVGDTVEFSFGDSATKIPAPSGGSNQYLSTLSQEGYLAHQVSDNPKSSFQFTEEMIPNIEIDGIYFNGNDFENIFGPTIKFDTETKKNRYIGYYK